MRKKISLVERNQDFKGQPIYHELRNYPKTYFSGKRMMLVMINKKIYNLKVFRCLSISHQNQQNFKRTVKMISLLSPVHHPEAQYFYLKF